MNSFNIKKLSTYRPAEGISVKEYDCLRADQVGTRRQLILEADSAYDFIEFTRPTGYVERTDGWLAGTPNRNHSSVDYSSDGWSGTKTYEDWLKMLDTGWQEGVEKATRMASKLAPKLLGAKLTNEQKNDYEGDEVNVDLYLEGDPQCMLDHDDQRKEGNAKFLSVGISVGTSWRISVEALLWRGIIAAAVVDTLEASGYRLSVYAYVNTYSKDPCLIVYPIKLEHQVLDLERVLVLSGHAAVFRRMIFSCMEKFPESKMRRYFGYNYGKHVGQVPTKELECDLYIDKDCLATDEDDAFTRYIEKLSELPDFHEFLKEERAI